MTAILLYRISAVVFALFAAGHTMGFLKFTPSTPAGVKVRDDMQAVEFPVGSQIFSYASFYKGFGLCISLYLAFFAYLSWHLSSMAAHNPQAIGMLGWAMCALAAGTLALSWTYFFRVTAMFAAVLVALLAWAAVIAH